MAMATKSFLWFCCVVICISISPSLAETNTCKSYRFSTNQEFQSCTDLPVLTSFLHWTYYPTTMTADIAFRKTQTSTTTWIVWSLNPTGQKMLGSQALVAFHNSDGIPTAYTTQIDSYQPSMQNGSLSFGVSNIRAEYANNQMIIFATLHLDNSLIKTNQVWQEGPMSGTSFSMHSMSASNQRSVGTIDFSTGAGAGATTTTRTAASSNTKKKNVHGVLNAVSWGFMMPVGIMLARYLKAFKVTNPAWFYLHGGCQLSAYIIGVAGWGTGMSLGTRSPGITHSTHRILGITLFCFATLQVFALFMRPKPDHKYRIYWNIYHRTIGYATLVMSIVNIYKGLHILQADHIWKKIYTAIIIVLALIAAVLEIITWLLLLCSKREIKDSSSSSSSTSV
ncbi:cytochrome b561 and DOMON domain-containing protein At5g47530-like [Euphorbia lathyris]|uniref:cytochrome b561 and DOMON domain-containing protein At5g47530-like n=1 Tax=Euphorbia lathyris TaxID=212925 RepID=UPI0033138347